MLSRIERDLPGYSGAERRVAEWVLAHPRQAAHATLKEVAAACGSSEPTVIRFCRRLGLAGFREFTLRLTASLSRPASYLHRDVSPDDGIADAVAKVLDASIQALVDTRAAIAELPLDETVSVIKRSRQLVFAGLGASGHVAADARHKFFRLAIPCAALTDPPGMLQFAAVAEPDDTLFFISARGAWPETVEAARTAAARGATVIALTDPASALASAASLVLGSESAEDTSIYTPMSSRLAHLAILDALLVSVALAIGPAASERLRASKDAIARRTAG